MVGDADKGTGSGPVSGDDVGAVNPDVALFEAGGAVRRDFDGGKGGRLFWHAAILNVGDTSTSGRVELRSTTGSETRSTL